MEYVKLQDEILTIIMKNCRSMLPLEIIMFYHEHKSFDQLLQMIREKEEKST